MSTGSAFDSFAERIAWGRAHGFRVERLVIGRAVAEAMHADAQLALKRPVALGAWLASIERREVKVHGVTLEAGWLQHGGIPVSIADAAGVEHSLGKVSFSLDPGFL